MPGSPQTPYRLVIGNKAWSSWSLRPWLVLKHFNLPFEEVPIALRQPGTRAEVLQHSASGKVPALYCGDLLVWDSLAIIETLADRHPGLAIWPGDPDARAVARSVSAEMHAGFQALREQCPMDLLEKKPLQDMSETTELNVRRIIASWRDCRRRFGGAGPFLFSDFSAADAMYAPVASRFRTYVPDLERYGDDGTASAYIEAIFALPAMQEWAAGAARELASG
jgi:glutathione S-transferase